MKGFLTFIVLRLISKKSMNGEEIRCELKKRRGQRPSPGTIYPVLKNLLKNGFIKVKNEGKSKRYTITAKGVKELNIALKKFVAIFCDMKDEF